MVYIEREGLQSQGDPDAPLVVFGLQAEREIHAKADLGVPVGAESPFTRQVIILLCEVYICS